MPTDYEYLEDLRAFAEELGRTPTRREMNEDGPHSSMPYYNRWGSWNAALEAADLELNHRQVTREELLEELRRLADEYGEPVRYDDVAEHGKYGPRTYYREFDTWFDAREAAGLNPEHIRPERRADPEELIEAMRELAREVGRPPLKSDMRDHGAFSVTPYLTRWDTWERALEAAGVATQR